LASLEGPAGPTGGYPQHFIGASYGGGTVFYVYDNGQHGLIVSDMDISTGVAYTTSGNVSMARGDGVGAGEMNTTIIIAVEASQGGGSFAAVLCSEYSINVNGVTYGDWYLPSKHELNLLYLEKSTVGIPNQSYWSSTENNSSSAWRQVFGDGTQNSVNKNTSNYVRAIRAF
jgi:hypothetical protein